MASFITPSAGTFPTTGNVSLAVSQNVSNHESKTRTPTPTPNPQQCHLLQTTHATPPAPALALLQPTVVWFREDLRLHDHPAIHTAVSDSHTIAALLLVPQKPTRFWSDAARDLRDGLRCRGAELYVRRVVGSAPDAVLSFVEEVGAGAVHFHTGVTRDARVEEEVLGQQLTKRGVRVKKFWTGALHAPQQLPFRIESMPEDCDSFEQLTRDVVVEKPLSAPESVVSISGIDAGDLPIGEGIVGGGEQMGLVRVEDFVNGKGLVDVKGELPRRSFRVIDTKFGRLQPFLTMGCVSPRRVWHDVMEKVSEQSLRRWCAMYELSLRNFFMFLTLKKGVYPA